MSMILNLPPRTLQVWAVLMMLTPKQRRARPQTEVAERLGVTRSAICHQVRKLIKTGVVKRGPGNRLIVRRPRAGSVIHNHDHHTECIGLPQHVELAEWIAQLNRCGTIPSNVKQFPTMKCATLLVPLSGEQEKDKSMDLSDIKSLKEQAAMFNKPAPRKPSSRDQYLMRQYTTRRKRFDPNYEPRSKAWLCIRKARTRLEHKGIPVKKWGPYLDSLFEDFPRIAQGKIDFPPPSVVGSDYFLDCYLGQPGNRKIPAARVRDLLRREGFDNVNPRVASMMLPDALREGHVPGDIEAPYDEAVQWLLDHFDEVGYA